MHVLPLSPHQGLPAQGSPGDPPWRHKGKALIQPRERSPAIPSKGGGLVGTRASRLRPSGVAQSPPWVVPASASGPSPEPRHPWAPYRTMSCKALSSGFSWYWMPCLAHRDFTSGAILWKLCRGMVGNRLRGARGSVRVLPPLGPEAGRAQGGLVYSSPYVPTQVGGCSWMAVFVLWGLEGNLMAGDNTMIF